MLAETAVKYYHMGYNCAESIIRAGNEVYGLDLHDRDMKMTAAFGGGFQIGDVCGALCGAACVVSARYVETKAHDCSFLRTLTQKLVIAFQNKMGSRLCAKIKPVYHSKEKKCEHTVETAAAILEEVIREWDEETKQNGFVFSIDSYGECGGFCRIDSAQINHTVFEDVEEAKKHVR